MYLVKYYIKKTALNKAVFLYVITVYEIEILNWVYQDLVSVWLNMARLFFNGSLSLFLRVITLI